MHQKSAPVHKSGASLGPADLPLAASAILTFLFLCAARLSRCEKGTRRCRAGSPEEPAPGSVCQPSRLKEALEAQAGAAGDRGRARNGGRGATPRLAPPTSH